jgi:hypothetical protein
MIKKRANLDNPKQRERICITCDNNYIKKYLFDIFWKEKLEKDKAIDSRISILEATNEQIKQEQVKISKTNSNLNEKIKDKSAYLTDLAQEQNNLNLMIDQKNLELKELTEQEQKFDDKINYLMKQLKTGQDLIYELQEEVNSKNKANMTDMQVEADLKSEISGLINSIYQKKKIPKESTTELETETFSNNSQKSNKIIYKSVAPGPKKRYYNPNERNGCDCKCSVM